MNTFNRSIVCAVASVGFAGLTLAGPAAADLSGEPQLPSRIVRANDLDLSRIADAQTLYARIVAAARRVCTEYHSDSWDNKRVTHRKECVTSTVESAVRAANHPVLTAVHQREVERLASLAD